ncbi:MAG: VWA domain-containing protein [Bacteroidales bacterium]|nr:VWA domain-containing protein [Bacteroidales bacterium]
MKTRIFNLIIIDESGSMEYIKHQAISGLNETIQTIRKAQTDFPDQEHFVSLVSFNSECIKTIHDCIPASSINEIDAEKYCPNYGTPLFDAMGFSINKLRQHVAPDNKVLVTIITDGYENTSREYDNKAIKALVENLKTNGWVFTYIGANQDAINFAKGISINNALNFEASDEGTKAMFMKESKSRMKFFDYLSKPQTSAKEQNYHVDKDFFSE